MIALLIAGPVLGVLAPRSLKGDPDDPSVAMTTAVGVIGSVVGGVGTNLLRAEDWP